MQLTKKLLNHALLTLCSKAIPPKGILMQPPQKALHLKRNRLLEGYLKGLKAAADEQLNKANQNRPLKVSSVWRPLEDQIKHWWANLPPSLCRRRFQLAEIAGQCCGRGGGKPANREVAAALRALGWREFRDWTSAGRNKRFWRFEGSTE